MRVFLILTEATLLRLLWRALWRRATCVVGTRSLILGSGAYLDRLVEILRACGRVERLEKDLLELVDDRFFGDMIRHTNIFAESEAWLEDRLGFQFSDERFGEFAVAFRHACANAAFDRFALAHAVHGIGKRVPDLSVGGLDCFDRGYAQHRYGHAPGSPAVPDWTYWVANALLAGLACLKTMAWIARRIKAAPLPAQRFRLACDYMEHPTNPFLWSELADLPDEVLVVFRSQPGGIPAEVVGRHHAAATDGWFSMADGVRAFTRTLADHLHLLRHAGHLPSDFFRRIIALGYRRIMYRALFNRFECAYFWGRDDYNPEHALRSVELRRKGGVSMGMMHGIPSIAAIVHQWRHLDFDVYYVHGRHLPARYYRDRWPASMRVVPIGSSGMSREEMKRLAVPESRTGVACFLSVTFQIAETIEAIRILAEAFPERTFFINFKGKDLDEPTFGPPITALLESGVKNVVRHPGRSYELFFVCDTVLSDGTTLAAEAIQFGLRSYVFDFFPEQWKSFPYRDFPGACVDSAASVITLMRSNQAFPRHKWAAFIEMSGLIPWDVIRQDMNLPAKDGPLLELAVQPDG